VYVACPGHVCELKLMSCRLGNVCLIEGVSEHGEALGPPSGMRRLARAKTGSNGKSRVHLASRYDI